MVGVGWGEMAKVVFVKSSVKHRATSVANRATNDRFRASSTYRRCIAEQFALGHIRLGCRSHLCDTRVQPCALFCGEQTPR